MTITQLSMLPHPPTRRRLLRNDIYDTIVECILDGSLAPGSRLRDAELTQWLTVSRTPIREALARLMVVGLIHTEPNRYTIVAPLDVGEVREAIEVLRLLLPPAIRSAESSPDHEPRERMLVILSRLEKDPTFDSPSAFEQLLALVIRDLGNSVLEEAADTAYLRFVRYLRLEVPLKPVMNRERVTKLASSLCYEHSDAATDLDAIFQEALSVLSTVNP